MQAALKQDEEIERLALEEMEAIEAARHNPLAFTTYTKPDYEINWHHAVVASYLDRFVSGEIKRLMIFMPPRHGKSELVSRRLPAYIFGKNPNAEIIACSYSADLASRMNRDVQRIMDDERYQNVFPEVKLFGANVRTVAKGSWLRNSDIFEIVDHRGVYRSSGVGGGITGMGAHYAIIDDPIKNAKEAASKVFRESQWEWYTSTLLTRLEKNGGILITNTRWHEDDICGRLLKQAAADPEADQWVVLNLPAVCEEITDDDQRDIGEVLWPNKYPLERLNKIKAANIRVWNALFQQRPSAQEGNILKREWWKFYSELPPKFDKIIQSWDMSFKEGNDNSFVVGFVMGKIGERYLLLNRIRRQMGFTKTIEAFLSMSQMYPQSRDKYVEDKANGPAIIETLKAKISGIIPVNPEGSKTERAEAVSWLVEAGNVELPDPTKNPWVNEFIEECASFPNGAFDDQVDAFTQGLAKLANIKSSTDRLKALLNF